jgi:hypothetical protein
VSADTVIALARQLPCRYPAKGDTCDDHLRKHTPDFTPCDPCKLRRLALMTRKSDGS